MLSTEESRIRGDRAVKIFEALMQSDQLGVFARSLGLPGIGCYRKVGERLFRAYRRA
jgi:hypothetical protein